MGTRPPEDPAEQSTSVLARLTMATAEDPFGPGDPLEVARLVRRTLAAAGRKAGDVTDLVVATAVPVPTDALGRFARRALGPHGAWVSRWVSMVPAESDHEHRLEAGLARFGAPASVMIVAALGPGDRASVAVVAADGKAHLRDPERPDPFWGRLEASTDEG
jgi:hypothetical protein